MEELCVLCKHDNLSVSIFLYQGNMVFRHIKVILAPLLTCKHLNISINYSERVPMQGSYVTLVQNYSSFYRTESDGILYIYI